MIVLDKNQIAVSCIQDHGYAMAFEPPHEYVLRDYRNTEVLVSIIFNNDQNAIEAEYKIIKNNSASPEWNSGKQLNDDWILSESNLYGLPDMLMVVQLARKYVYMHDQNGCDADTLAFESVSTNKEYEIIVDLSALTQMISNMPQKLQMKNIT